MGGSTISQDASVLVVLVVDDEALIRDLAQRVLERAGYAVLSAQDGHEALRILRRRPGLIDLVILDLTMPDLSGHDILAEIREMGCPAKVIVCSGVAGEAEDVEGLLAAGAAGFLPKPFQLGELTARVRQVLGQRQESVARSQESEERLTALAAVGPSAGA